jgi:hypothetical protein
MSELDTGRSDQPSPDQSKNPDTPPSSGSSSPGADRPGSDSPTPSDGGSEQAGTPGDADKGTKGFPDGYLSSVSLNDLSPTGSEKSADPLPPIDNDKRNPSGSKSGGRGAGSGGGGGAGRVDGDDRVLGNPENTQRPVPGGGGGGGSGGGGAGAEGGNAGGGKSGGGGPADGGGSPGAGAAGGGGKAADGGGSAVGQPAADGGGERPAGGDGGSGRTDSADAGAAQPTDTPAPTDQPDPTTPAGTAGQPDRSAVPEAPTPTGTPDVAPAGRDVAQPTDVPGPNLTEVPPSPTGELRPEPVGPGVPSAKDFAEAREWLRVYIAEHHPIPFDSAAAAQPGHEGSADHTANPPIPDQTDAHRADPDDQSTRDARTPTDPTSQPTSNLDGPDAPEQTPNTKPDADPSLRSGQTGSPLSTTPTNPPPPSTSTSGRNSGFAGAYLAGQGGARLDFAIPVPADLAATNEATNESVMQVVSYIAGERPVPIGPVQERPMTDAEAYNVWGKIQPDLYLLTDAKFRESYHGLTKEQVTNAFADAVGRVREGLARMPKAEVDHQYHAEQNLKVGIEVVGKMADPFAAAAVGLARMTGTRDPHKLNNAADAGTAVGGVVGGIAGMKRGSASEGDAVRAGKAPANAQEIRRTGYPSPPTPAARTDATPSRPAPARSQSPAGGVITNPLPGKAGATNQALDTTRPVQPAGTTRPPERPAPAMDKPGGPPGTPRRPDTPATAPKTWPDLVRQAELPQARQEAGGYRSQIAESGNRSVIVVEGPVGAKLPQSESLARGTPKLDTEHGTHAVGLQLGENLPEGIISAPGRELNLSQFKSVENAIRQVADKAAEHGARVETRTVLQVEKVSTPEGEIPVLVGATKEAWVCFPGSDRTQQFVDFSARVDPNTRAVTIIRDKVTR